MAMARINRPSIMVYGGTIKAGFCDNKKLDIVSAFEAYGQYLSKEIDEAEMQKVLHHACPGPALAEECTQQIQWLQQLKHLE